MTVYKMIEVVGTSNRSASDAIKVAVKRASETLEDLGWFEVKEIRGRIVDGKVEEFQVKLDIGFRLHSKQEMQAAAAAAANPMPSVAKAVSLRPPPKLQAAKAAPGKAPMPKATAKGPASKAPAAKGGARKR